MPEKIMEAQLPLKAGSIRFERYTAEGLLTGDIANQHVDTGVVMSIKYDFNTTSKAIEDGNSAFPAAQFDTNSEGKITVNMNTYNQATRAFLAGAEIDEKAVDVIVNINNVERTIPSSTAYIVNVDLPVENASSVLIVDKKNNYFTAAAATDPVAGEYKLDATDKTKFTFNVADAGKEVFISHDTKAASASVAKYKMDNPRPVVHAIIQSESTDVNQVAVNICNVIIDRCKATGALNPPESKKSPDGWSYELTVLKPRNGMEPVKDVYTRKI